MSKKINQYVLLPLYPFSCDREVVKLKWGIRITRASDDLRQYISKLYTSYDDILRDVSELEWMAYLPFVGKHIDDALPIPRKYEEDTDSMDDIAYIFVTALRLHGEGLITPGPIVDAQTYHSFETYWLNRSVRWDYPLYMDKALSKFELHQSDAAVINEILQDVHNWRKKRKLDGMHIAIERFHSSYYGTPEEKLIDQMIAFEAIYLGDDKELGYKLSLRTAYLIGKDIAQRTAIFNDMKDAYAIRGNIVHGGEKVDMAHLIEILPKTENYLRESIRKVLSLLSDRHEFKEIRRHWFDNNILKGEAT
jgi:hypothetical protein